MSITPYILCGAGNCIQLSQIQSLYMLPTHSIYSPPHGSGERFTAFGVNAGTWGGAPACKGSCPLDRVLRRGPRLSSPGVAPLSWGLWGLPGSLQRPGLFPCIARGLEASSMPVWRDRGIVHLTGGKSPVTGDFYRYRYLAATLTGGKFQKISPKFKIFKKIRSVISGLPVGLPIPLNGGNCFTAGKANPG